MLSPRSASNSNRAEVEVRRIEQTTSNNRSELPRVDLTNSMASMKTKMNNGMVDQHPQPPMPQSHPQQQHPPQNLGQLFHSSFGNQIDYDRLNLEKKIRSLCIFQDPPYWYCHPIQDRGLPETPKTSPTTLTR